MIAEMVHAQMGALTYQGAFQLQLQLRRHAAKQAASQRLKKKAEQYFSESKYHLEKAHNKDWTMTLIRQWHGVGCWQRWSFERVRSQKRLPDLQK